MKQNILFRVEIHKKLFGCTILWESKGVKI